jgi:hypothetical protein
MQVLEKQGQQIGAERRDDANFESTRKQTFGLASQIANLVGFLDDAAGPDHDALADRGDGDRAIGSLEKGYPEKILQLAQLRAERGLGDMAPFRRMAEMSQIGHRDEIPQLGERHWLLLLPSTASIDVIYIMD